MIREREEMEKKGDKSDTRDERVEKGVGIM